MKSRISPPTALLGLLLLGATACGQKGPLFLPDDPEAGRVAVPGPAPRPERAQEPEPDEDADVGAQEEPPHR